MESSKTTQQRSKFSARTCWNTAETAWAQALAERRRSGQPVYDLTEANPTKCGFEYDENLLLALQQDASRVYAPEPFGLDEARKGVCAYYEEHRADLAQQETHGALKLDLAPKQVILTASTSEAYSFLFRLLCDPGDEILIAQPGYPLFDFLAALEDVRLASYPLFYDHGWHIDTTALRGAITPRTRAMVLVHPNNPSGHFTSWKDRRYLETICVEFGLALIVDEVFLDYSLGEVAPSFVMGEHPALTFVLSGLSKVAGLPQMKVSWLSVLGPQKEQTESLARLEVIADTFLSVSTPAQHALSQWLQRRQPLQEQIRARIRNNLVSLDRMLRACKTVDRLEVGGGWYATLRAPATASGEEIALRLLVDDGVAVHPWSFFGMAGDRNYVVSLLPRTAAFEIGVEHLLHTLDRA